MRTEPWEIVFCKRKGRDHASAEDRRREPYGKFFQSGTSVAVSYSPTISRTSLSTVLILMLGLIIWLAASTQMMFFSADLFQV